jgi:hypothetical protein
MLMNCQPEFQTLVLLNRWFGYRKGKFSAGILNVSVFVSPGSSVILETILID